MESLEEDEDSFPMNFGKIFLKKFLFLDQALIVNWMRETLKIGKNFKGNLIPLFTHTWGTKVSP